MRIHANEASALVSVFIAGVNNRMADFSSRTFSRKSATKDTFTIPDEVFLHTFSTAFPLQNNDSWRIFRFSNKLASWIFSKLRGEASTLGSWKQITGKRSFFGGIGKSSSPPSMEWMKCSLVCQTPSPLNYSQLLLNRSGTAITATTLELGLAPYKSRYVPLARLSRWTDCPTQPKEVKASTGFNLNA
jgi:hypothetical protein